jgi:hypothetical protein
MGKYVKDWETLKTNFEANTGKTRPKETVKKAIIGTVQKASGLTPLLKDIDSAIEKKERLNIEKALNKFHSVQESYVMFLQNERKPYLAMTNDGDEDMLKEYGKLISGLLNIEKEVADDAKKVQEQKSGDGASSITWLFLEADVKGTIAKAKKDFTPFAALEKKFNLIKKADPSLAVAQEYTKAAAHTEVAKALAALKDFQIKAAACATACDTALKDKDAVKSQPYINAVKSYQKAMRDLSTAARIADQIRRLTAMQAAHS